MPSKKQGAKKKSAGKKRGRKEKYPTHVKPRLKEITEWCRQGLIEVEICRRLGISVGQFNEYKKTNPELTDAIKEGRCISDAAVEDSLYKRAQGYSYTETESRLNKNGKMVKVKETEKEIAPDVTAQIFWLKNRKSKEWRDKQHLEFDGDVNITVKKPEGIEDVN